MSTEIKTSKRVFKGREVLDDGRLIAYITKEDLSQEARSAYYTNGVLEASRIDGALISLVICPNPRDMDDALVGNISFLQEHDGLITCDNIDTVITNALDSVGLDVDVSNIRVTNDFPTGNIIRATFHANDKPEPTVVDSGGYSSFITPPSTDATDDVTISGTFDGTLSGVSIPTPTPEKTAHEKLVDSIVALLSK